MRVREPVSTVLEMTEIQTRLMAEGGPAVMFEKPIRADGTPSRHAGAGQSVRHGQARRHGRDLGGKDRTTAADLREVGELLAFLRQPEPPRGFGEALELLPLVKTVLAHEAQDRGQAPPARRSCCKGDDIDLAKLPIQTCWPGEPAPLITWPLVVTKGPGDAREDNLQSRHLPHAGAGQGPTIMRWLHASRRGAASPPLGRRRSPRPCPPRA